MRALHFACLILFAASLAMSIFVGAMQDASALTAATFANQSTFTSISTRNAWDKVYVNQGGTKTYFLEHGTDENAASSTWKSAVLDNSAYTTTTTSNLIMGGGGTSLSSETGSTTKNDVNYLQSLGGTTQNLNNAGTTFFSESVATASSQLVGATVNELHIWIKKTGAPASSTATFAVFDSSCNTVYQFGTVDVSTLTTSFVETTFRGATTGRTLANGDRIGAFYNGGSAGNSLDIDYVNSDKYDGTTNTITHTATGVQGSCTPTAQTGREVRMQLGFDYVAALANDGNTASTWENGAYVVRGTQTNFDATVTLDNTNVAVAEKLTTSGAFCGTNILDRITLWLFKTASPTGTATIAILDASNNIVSTIGTLDVSTLTTSVAPYTFTSGSDVSFCVSATQYIGIKYTGGTAVNKVNVELVNTDSFGGTTNNIRSVYAVSWTDTTTSDLAFRVIDTEANDQESGAFLKWDAGSAQNTIAVKAYWPDTTKIPSSIKLSTSTDDVSYTDRVTITPTVAAAYEFLEFDAGYSVRYVKLTVVTWGSANSMAISELQRVPYLNSATTDSAFSAIQEQSGSYYAYYMSGDDTNDLLYLGEINIVTGDIVWSLTSADTTMSFNSGQDVSIVVTKNKVYNVMPTGGSVAWQVSTNLDGTGIASATPTGGISVPATSSLNCILGLDGAGATTDKYYCMVYSASGTSSQIFKVVNGAETTIVNYGTANTVTQARPNVHTSATAIFNRVVSGAETTAAVNISADTASDVYTQSWVTYPTQAFTFDGTTRTYDAGRKVYIATSTYPIAYSSAGVVTDPDTCYVETVTSASNTANCIDDNPYYRISDTLIVSGSTTTWTPRTITAGTTLTLTPYTEVVSVPLTNANYSIIQTNVIKLACDATYPVYGRIEKVGSVADCTKWRILPTSTDTVGRELPYAATINLIHANPQTSYTIQLSVSGDPSIYFLTSIYDGKNIDTGAFDSGGAIGQHLLYGQCYTMQITETSSGNVVQTGTICANDITTKTVSLSGITIPNDWLRQTWSHSITRNKTNESNNGLLFAIQKSQSPYNASVYVVNNMLTSEQTYQQWFNFTNVSGISVVNVTGRASDETIYFTVYENDVLALNDVSYADPNIGPIFPEATFGLIFGLPLAMVFPIMTAALFPKRLAYFGSIVTVAVIGIMAVFRIIDLPGWFWAIIMPVLAISILVGFKRT